MHPARVINATAKRISRFRAEDIEASAYFKELIFGAAPGVATATPEKNGYSPVKITLLLERFIDCDVIVVQALLVQNPLPQRARLLDRVALPQRAR